MKKHLYVIAILVCGFVSAQEEASRKDITERKHEVRLDAIELVVSGMLELNYEYVLSKYSGVGGFIAVDLDENDFDFTRKFAIGGFYRQYFFNKKDFGARGLFAEGLLQYGLYEEERYIDFDPVTNNDIIQTEDYGALGAGFAVGQKWVSTNGFIFEISAGMGRNFGVDEELFENEFFFRGGILVGYRF